MKRIVLDPSWGPHWKLAIETARAEKTIELLGCIRTLAVAGVNALLLGEPGVGKSFYARLLHEASERKDAPFIVCDGGRLSEELVLADLFGHVKGAFTGADRAKQGKFDLVKGGTLFIDEVGNLGSRAQAALLRACQERTYSPVGGEDAGERKFEGVIVCGTNADLALMVAGGSYREDLVWRIGPAKVVVPPLSERPEDIRPLALAFAKALKAELTEDTLAFLEARSWPGNVRELENTLKVLAAFADQQRCVEVDVTRSLFASGLIGRLMEPLARSAAGASNESVAASSSSPISNDGWLHRPAPSGGRLKAEVDEAEKRCISAAFEKSGGNLSSTAAFLGVSRNYLRRRLLEIGARTQPAAERHAATEPTRRAASDPPAAKERQNGAAE